jgi:recombination protein RecT
MTDPQTQVAVSAPRTLKDMLALPAYQSQLQKAMPKGLTAERMVRVVLTAMHRTPKLMECTKESVWQAVLDSASLGLFPDALGRSYLVPYKDKCQLIIGYKGLVDLIYRSGQVDFIQAYAVHRGDAFSVVLGTEQKINHVPCENHGEWTHVYSVAKIKGSDSSSFVVMNRSEVMKIKARSKASGSGPWQTDEEEMAKKTVIRRHAKILPMSAEIVADALDRDSDQYVIDATPSAANRADEIAAPPEEKTIDATVEQVKKEDGNANDPTF